MVTQQERNRLIEKYRHEPLYAAVAVVKCTVCLAVIAGLAVIGARVETSGDNLAFQAKLPERSSVAHSRAVYQEREARIASARVDAATASQVDGVRKSEGAAAVEARTREVAYAK